MKTSILFLGCFITYVAALTCYSSMENNRKHCHSSDRFCAQISIVDSYSPNFGIPQFLQGCSHDVRQIYDAPCENVGVSDVYQKGGGNAWHGILSCCDTNHCNSAATFSTLFSIAFVIFINAFLFFK